MPRNLKLTGLKTYTGAAVKNTVVNKGEIVRLNDDIAALVEQGGRASTEGDFIGYFSDAPEGVPVNHNFSDDKEAEVIKVAKVLPGRRSAKAEEEPDATQTDVSPAKRSSTVQRRTPK